MESISVADKCQDIWLLCNLCNFNYFLSLSRCYWIYRLQRASSMWSIWESLADVMHQQRTHAHEHKKRAKWSIVQICCILKETHFVHLFACNIVALQCCSICIHILMFLVLVSHPFRASQLHVFDWKLLKHFKPIFSHFHIVCSWKLACAKNDVLWISSVYKWMFCSRHRKLRSLFVHHVECFIDIQQCSIHNKTIIKHTHTLYACLFCQRWRQRTCRASRLENENGKKRRAQYCIYIFKVGVQAKMCT